MPENSLEYKVVGRENLFYRQCVFVRREVLVLLILMALYNSYNLLRCGKILVIRHTLRVALHLKKYYFLSKF